MPVNVLVGLEYLKAGHGWTDEEMYDAFRYDVQVRNALGNRQLGEGDFDLRSLYYFLERLSRPMQETGRNLLDQAFDQVTDAQIAAFRLMMGKQWESRRPAEGFFTEQWKEFMVGKHGHRPTVTYYECPVVVDNRFDEVIKADQPQGEAV